ncbi:hypothetical protein VTN02DRAFT_3485 [Thermoascus thermophilus]
MQPPSDAFGHQCRKLAEVLADLRNRASSSSTTAPPPPYSLNAATVPIRDDTLSDVDCEDEEDGGVADATVVPITIKIDASINIVGHGNTVVIPSGSASGVSSTRAGTTTGSMTAASQTPSSSQTQSIEPQQQLLQHRQARLTQLATSVIDALSASRLLEDRAPGRCRPIELTINTGIRIQGSRNVVCASAPDRTANRIAKPNANDNNLGRKRRAQSEPPEIPKAKRLPVP